MNAYITLKGTDEEDSYQFRVILDGYRPVRIKAGNIQNTVTGKVDRQSGPLNLEWEYVVQVAATDPVGGDYGTLSNLKALFDLTTTLTLTDHYEATHTVWWVGEFAEQPHGPNLEGVAAWFLVPIHLIKTTAET